MNRSQTQNLIDCVVKSIREEKLTQEEIISYVKNKGVGTSDASWIVHEINRRMYYGDDETDWNELTDKAYERLSKECSSTDASGKVAPDVVNTGKEENRSTVATDEKEEARKRAEEEYARQVAESNRQMEEYNRQMEEYNRQMEEYNRQQVLLQQQAVMQAEAAAAIQVPAEKVKTGVGGIVAAPVQSNKESGFFSGRMSRGSYWMRCIFLALSFGCLEICLQSATPDSITTSVLFLLFGGLTFVFGIRWTTRRLHDTGLSGWWQLLGQFSASTSCALLGEGKATEGNQILGIIFAIFTLYYLYRLFLRGSQPGTNKYGRNPQENR